MKFSQTLSSLIISVLSILFVMNCAYASSGKISFEGTIVREACAVGNLDILEQASKKTVFNLTFSDCDINYDGVKVNFYDVSLGDRSNISKDIIFNLVENKEKIIEVDGNRYYLPMKLNGHYIQDENTESSSKLIALEYH